MVGGEALDAYWDCAGELAQFASKAGVNVNAVDANAPRACAHASAGGSLNPHKHAETTSWSPTVIQLTGRLALKQRTVLCLFRRLERGHAEFPLWA